MHQTTLCIRRQPRRGHGSQSWKTPASRHICVGGSTLKRISSATLCTAPCRCTWVWHPRRTGRYTCGFGCAKVSLCMSVCVRMSVCSFSQIESKMFTSQVARTLLNFARLDLSMSFAPVVLSPIRSNIPTWVLTSPRRAPATCTAHWCLTVEHPVTITHVPLI